MLGDHAPDTWVVVIDSPTSLTLSAMCVCDDPTCHYTVTWYPDEILDRAVHVERRSA